MKRHRHTTRRRKVAASPRKSRNTRAPSLGATPTILTRPQGAATSALAVDIGRLIEAARRQVAQTANVALTTRYWQIGARIRKDVLGQRGAEYGSQIVSAVGRQLEDLAGEPAEERLLRKDL